MRSLSGFLDSKEVFLKSDITDMNAEEIEKLFPPLGFFAFRLDGAGVKSKGELLGVLAAGLKFPAYFGYNWDALLDCLRSLPDFIQARGYVLIIERFDLFMKDSPADLEDFRDIAETAAGFLAEKYKLPFKIITL
ncbi:MAG: hypothetical protein A2270_09495 [Elusimicrobia bacterium RIFOXYA12_FULL_51_18]|nr:MAG: hypothetical protein A2270_09495 [Elusimicrobia bacterium RIFOXYA12_FULL_51_18]OGS32735.1 MAG: hypothetical protein A2218_11810 [Elusimicrobia bacterium RIFOXYA2_FULL_53_38]